MMMSSVLPSPLIAGFTISLVKNTKPFTDGAAYPLLSPEN
jgi:hypothetical protein